MLIIVLWNRMANGLFFLIMAPNTDSAENGSGCWRDRISTCAIICGLEIEEPAGACIIDYLESIARTPFVFARLAPGSSGSARDRLDRLFALHPILHLNRQEALSFTGAGF